MTQKKLKVAFSTLGCRVNQYETRAVEEEFVKLGFEIGKFSDICDAYVINTCTVTGESDRKSRQTVRRAIKNSKGCAVIAVMGCMSQINPDFYKTISGVDIVIGSGDKLSCAKKVLQVLQHREKTKEQTEQKQTFVSVEDIFSYDTIEEMSVTGSDNTRAFLKVVDGCENNCSYCIIPKARGKVRSKDMEKVCKECANITDVGGCREIVLTGIETAAYGKDKGYTLCDLVENVSKNENVARIRLGSLEPTVLKEDFVKRLSQISSFMPHFHLSLQSGSDSVLARMKRKYNTQMFYEKVLLLRKYFPYCEITTDIIVGFPGETDEEFMQTLDFVEKCEFLYVHIFPYSDRIGTEASTYPDKIDDQVKKQRVHLLTQRMMHIRKRVLEKYIGKNMQVLCETKKGEYVHGYTQNYIEVHFKGEDLSPNDIVNVKLAKIKNDGEYVLGVI